MADQKHLTHLKEGVAHWNRWRLRNPSVQPDLRDTNLRGVSLPGIDLSGALLRRSRLQNADLSGANLRHARLTRANLRETNFQNADLRGTSLRKAKISGAVLKGANLADASLAGAKLRNADLSLAILFNVDFADADLSGANLDSAILHCAHLSGTNLQRAHLQAADLTYSDISAANLRNADLSTANLSRASLRGCDLSYASLVDSILTECRLSDCRVFGVSAWRVSLDGAMQQDLIITPPDEPTITTDNLEVSQFLDLLLTSHKLRGIIETITSKVVLILGRFTPARKAVLDRLRFELRRRDYLPIIFDFDKPITRNFTETVSTLAHMARFVIADLTEPRSIPQELQRIVPDLPSVPVQPILQRAQSEWGMFADLLDYGTMLPVYQYDTMDELVQGLLENVIAPAEHLANRIAALRTRSVLSSPQPLSDPTKPQDGGVQ